MAETGFSLAPDAGITLQRTRRSAGGNPVRDPEGVTLARWFRSVIEMPAVIGLAMTAGIFFNGYDSAVGQAVCCLVNASFFAMMVIVRPPSLRFWRRTAPVMLLAGAAIAWLVLVNVWNSMRDGDLLLAPDMFLPKFLSIVAGLVALIVGARVGWRGRQRRAVVDSVLVAINVHLVLAVFLLNGGGGGAWDGWTLTRDGRFAGLIGNANVTAAVCGAAVLLSLANMLATLKRRKGDEPRSHRRLRLVFYGGTLVLSLSCAVLTAGRFPVLVTLLLMAVLVVAERQNIARRIRHFLPSLASVVVTVAAVMLLYSGLLIERLWNLGAEAGLRYQLWEQFAWAAWQHPVFGYGPGSFTALNEITMVDEVDTPAPWMVNSPHNLFLQLLLNGGVIYAALMILAALKAWRDTEHRWPRQHWDPLQRGLAAVVLLFLACSMVDIPLDFAATTCLMLFLGGIAWGQALSRRAPLARLK